MDIKFNNILYTKNSVREGVRKGMLVVFDPTPTSIYPALRCLPKNNIQKCIDFAIHYLLNVLFQF